MRLTLGFAIAGTFLVFAQSSSAASVPFTGALGASDPVYARPQAGNPPTLVSGAGSAVSYDLFPFFVTSADTYTLRTLTANLAPSTFGADDTFMVLYQNAFNPATPLTNALQADDDSGGGGLSLISRALNPGVQYFMVVTSFSNGAFGDYTGSISNPGAGTAVLGVVPEPSSAMMMLAALAVGGLVVARRRQT